MESRDWATPAHQVEKTQGKGSRDAHLHLSSPILSLKGLNVYLKAAVWGVRLRNSESMICHRLWGDWQEISPPLNGLPLPNSGLPVSPWEQFVHLLVWSPIFYKCVTEDTSLDRLVWWPVDLALAGSTWLYQIKK